MKTQNPPKNPDHIHLGSKRNFFLHRRKPGWSEAGKKKQNRTKEKSLKPALITHVREGSEVNLARRTKSRGSAGGITTSERRNS